MFLAQSGVLWLLRILATVVQTHPDAQPKGSFYSKTGASIEISGLLLAFFDVDSFVNSTRGEILLVVSGLLSGHRGIHKNRCLRVVGALLLVCAILSSTSFVRRIDTTNSSSSADL